VAIRRPKLGRKRRSLASNICSMRTQTFELDVARAWQRVERDRNGASPPLSPPWADRGAPPRNQWARRASRAMGAPRFPAFGALLLSCRIFREEAAEPGGLQTALASNPGLCRPTEYEGSYKKPPARAIPLSSVCKWMSACPHVVDWGAVSAQSQACRRGSFGTSVTWKPGLFETPGTGSPHLGGTSALRKSPPVQHDSITYGRPTTRQQLKTVRRLFPTKI